MDGKKWDGCKGRATDLCLERISTWLEKKKSFKGKHLQAICQALEIVLKNNRLVCGDLFAKQIKGIATGTSPATSIANLFLGIFEEEEIIDQFKPSLPFLKRFIDDGCGIWKHHPNAITDESLWQAFKNKMNESGVKWIFSKREKHAVFLDMNITLKHSSVITSLFSKPLNLYLYIPPTSCHPKGVINGLVHGHLIRIHILCCESQTVIKETKLFTNHLLNRGYNIEELSPLILSATEKAEQYAKKILSSNLPFKNKAKQNDKSVFFHLSFHPSHPINKIKQAWKSLVANPLGKKTIERLNHLQWLPSSSEQTHYVPPQSKKPEHTIVLQENQQKKGAKNVILLGFDMSRPLPF